MGQGCQLLHLDRFGIGDTKIGVRAQSIKVHYMSCHDVSWRDKYSRNEHGTANLLGDRDADGTDQAGCKQLGAEAHSQDQNSCVLSTQNFSDRRRTRA